MRVYLVQHGRAKPKELDPQRPLSDQGVGGQRHTVWVILLQGKLANVDHRLSHLWSMPE